MDAEWRYREAQRTGRGYAEALWEYQAAERAAVVVLQGDEEDHGLHDSDRQCGG